MPGTTPRRLPKRVIALLVVAFLLPALAMAYVGLSARYVADDFCTASMLFDRGFVGSQQWWYLNWSGKFTYFLLFDALAWLGPWTVPVTPVLLLVAWVAASATALRPLLARTSNLNSWAHSILLALVLTSVTLGGAPGLWQVLYWQTGAVPYVVPIILGTLYVHTVWRAMAAAHAGRSKTPWRVAGVLLNVLAVGSSETAMLVLGGSLGLVWVATLAFYHGQERRLILGTLGVGLLAAVLAGLAVVASPGNAIRSGVFIHPGLDVVVGGAIWYPFWLLFSFVVHAPALAVLAYAVPFLVSRHHDASVDLLPRAHWANVRRVLLVATFPLIAVAGAPSLFVGGGLPPERAQIHPLLLLVLVLMSCGFLDGLSSRPSAAVVPNPWRRATLVVGLCGAIALGPLLVTMRVLAGASELNAYAATLDTIDRQARGAHTAGQPELFIQPIVAPQSVGLEQVGPDAAAWPNTCVAAYYGLERISARAALVPGPVG